MPGMTWVYAPSVTDHAGARRRSLAVEYSFGILTPDEYRVWIVAAPPNRIAYTPYTLWVRGEMFPHAILWLQRN